MHVVKSTLCQMFVLYADWQLLNSRDLILSYFFSCFPSLQGQ